MPSRLPDLTTAAIALLATTLTTSIPAGMLLCLQHLGAV